MPAALTAVHFSSCRIAYIIYYFSKFVKWKFTSSAIWEKIRQPRRIYTSEAGLSFRRDVLNAHPATDRSFEEAGGGFCRRVCGLAERPHTHKNSKQAGDGFCRRVCGLAERPHTHKNSKQAGGGFCRRVCGLAERPPIHKNSKEARRQAIASACASAAWLNLFIAYLRNNSRPAAALPFPPARARRRIRPSRSPSHRCNSPRGRVSR